MKIIIVGGTGTIGKKIAEDFKTDHEIVVAGSKSGDVQVDIESSESIEAMYKTIGKFDALVSATGKAHFGLLKEMKAADFNKGLQNKLLGQVNLVLIGQHYINAGGSFTLTSGVLAQDPIVYGVNLTAVNAAIEGFVKAAAVELRGVRINAVSPGVVEDSPGFFPYFPGFIPVKMAVVVNAYRKAVLGASTGLTIPAL